MPCDIISFNHYRQPKNLASLLCRGRDLSNYIHMGMIHSNRAEKYDNNKKSSLKN